MEEGGRAGGPGRRGGNGGRDHQGLPKCPLVLMAPQIGNRHVCHDGFNIDGKSVLDGLPQTSRGLLLTPPKQPPPQVAAERRLGTNITDYERPDVREAGPGTRTPSRPFSWPNWEKKPKTRALQAGGFSGARAASAARRRPHDTGRGLGPGAEPKKGRRGGKRVVADGGL